MGESKGAAGRGCNGRQAQAPFKPNRPVVNGLDCPEGVPSQHWRPSAGQQRSSMGFPNVAPGRASGHDAVAIESFGGSYSMRDKARSVSVSNLGEVRTCRASSAQHVFGRRLICTALASYTSPSVRFWPSTRGAGGVCHQERGAARVC